VGFEPTQLYALAPQANPFGHARASPHRRVTISPQIIKFL